MRLGGEEEFGPVVEMQKSRMGVEDILGVRHTRRISPSYS